MRSITGRIEAFSVSHKWFRYAVLLLMLIIAEALVGSLLATPGLAEGGLREILEDIPETSGMDTAGMDMGSTFTVEPRHLARDLAIAISLCAVLIATGRPLWVRSVLILYIAWLTAGVLLTTTIIILSLWNPEGRAIYYLFDGAITWAFTIVVFAAWYWAIDAENQAISASGEPVRLDFSFPQSGDTGGPWSGWRPGFVDYLFLAFNVSTSLSPTDTPCLSKRAKFLLVLQALISLVLIIMIVARAINVI